MDIVLSRVVKFEEQEDDNAQQLSRPKRRGVTKGLSFRQGTNTDEADSTTSSHAPSYGLAGASVNLPSLTESSDAQQSQNTAFLPDIYYGQSKKRINHKKNQISLEITGQDLQRPEPKAVKSTRREHFARSSGYGGPLTALDETREDGGDDLLLSSDEEDVSTMEQHLDALLKCHATGIPIEVSRGKGPKKKGRVARPVFHCRRCRDHWTQHHVLPSHCREAANPVHGPAFTLAHTATHLMKEMNNTFDLIAKGHKRSIPKSYGSKRSKRGRKYTRGSQSSSLDSSSASSNVADSDTDGNIPNRHEVNSRHRRKKYLNDDQSEEFKMKAVTIKIKRKLKRQMEEYSATETEEDALVEELLNTLLSDEDFDEDEKERLRRRIKKERRRELRKRKIVKCEDGEVFVDGSEGNIITVSTRRRRRKTGEKDRYQNGGRSKGENEPHFSEESLDNSEEDVDVRSRGSRGSRRKGKHKRRMSESHKEKYVTEEMRRGENRYESFERRGKGSRGHSKVHRQEAYTRKRADRKSRRQGHEEYSSEEEYSSSDESTDYSSYDSDSYEDEYSDYDSSEDDFIIPGQRPSKGKDDYGELFEKLISNESKSYRKGRRRKGDRRKKSKVEGSVNDEMKKRKESRTDKRRTSVTAAESQPRKTLTTQKTSSHRLPSDHSIRENSSGQTAIPQSRAIKDQSKNQERTPINDHDLDQRKDESVTLHETRSEVKLSHHELSELEDMINKSNEKMILKEEKVSSKKPAARIDANIVSRNNTVDKNKSAKPIIRNKAVKIKTGRPETKAGRLKAPVYSVTQSSGTHIVSSSTSVKDGSGYTLKTKSSSGSKDEIRNHSRQQTLTPIKRGGEGRKHSVTSHHDTRRMSNAHGIPASYLKDHSEAKLKQQTKAYHSKPLDGTEPSDATNTDATAPGEGLSGQIEDKMSPPPPPPRLLKERESTVTENVSPPSRPKKAPKAPQIRYAPTARRRVPSKATYPNARPISSTRRVVPPIPNAEVPKQPAPSQPEQEDNAKATKEPIVVGKPSVHNEKKVSKPRDVSSDASDTSTSSSESSGITDGESESAVWRTKLTFKDSGGISILSFTPAFSFSLFPLPQHYKKHNEQLLEKSHNVPKLKKIPKKRKSVKKPQGTEVKRPKESEISKLSRKVHVQLADPKPIARYVKKPTSKQNLKSVVERDEQSVEDPSVDKKSQEDVKCPVAVPSVKIHPTESADNEERLNIQIDVPRLSDVIQVNDIDQSHLDLRNTETSFASFSSLPIREMFSREFEDLDLDRFECSSDFIINNKFFV